MEKLKIKTPAGEFILCEEDGYLCRAVPANGERAPEKTANKTLNAAAKWFDGYFAGKRPDITALPLSPRGSEYQLKIWGLLCDIPYGTVATYGETAARYEKQTGKKTSARAVGRAVSKNPILIIIPCHRVTGADGSLTGYSGGLPMKKLLLEHEREKISGK